MRILLLTILFLSPLYYFTQQEDSPAVAAVDLVKLKQGAPERVERILTVNKTLPATPDAGSTDTLAASSPDGSDDESSDENNDMDKVEEVQWTDAEEGWNTELKQMLIRLEPADGEEMYNNYMKEQEGYQAELDSLQNEKQQKTSDEAISEIDQLVTQLDNRHQDRLKEILGAHYEAVRDQYQQYMDAAE